MESGGENYHYIPSLNDHDDHINLFVNLIKKHIQGWPIRFQIHNLILQKNGLKN